MGEREPRKEIIDKCELFFLCHPGTEDIFSGYGLTTQQGSLEFLVGLLMVDRPGPANPGWLKQVEGTFGECQLVGMTGTGERGIACRMQIEPESRVHLRRLPLDKADAIKAALEPLVDNLPGPIFSLRWDEEQRLWVSQVAYHNELSEELREVFEKFGYGCCSAETDVGVVHVCHASDADIECFTDKPVISSWQLIKMPTAPLIRLELVILDRSDDPYKFESFLNVAQEDQARVLAHLANQDRLYLAFYGDGLDYRFTKVIPHDRQQWQYLDELAMEAREYWAQIPPEERDFDRAKAEFMRRFI